MQRITYFGARVVGLVVLTVSAITTGVHTTRSRNIEANRASYDVLEQRIASDKSALVESSEQTPDSNPASFSAGKDTGQSDRSYRLVDEKNAEMELGLHSSKAEEQALFQMSSYHSFDDLGIGIGIILLFSGLAEGFLGLPED